MALLLTAATAWAQISFTSGVKKISNTELLLTFHATLEDGYHLNTDLVMENAEDVELVGELKNVREGVYEQRLKVKNAGCKFSGYLEYYACNETQCLAPASVDFAYDGSLKAVDSNGNAVPAADDVKQEAVAGEQEQVAVADVVGNDYDDQLISSRLTSPLWSPIIDELREFNDSPVPLQRSLFSIFAICFLGGLLTIFTPCVWPVIPLTVSLFIKRGEGRDEQEEDAPAFYSAFAEEDNRTWTQKTVSVVGRWMRHPGVHDAMLFGVSIIVLFMAFGILMTMLFGANAMNALSTNAIFNVCCFLVILAFGLSFLGLFEVRLPSKWMNALDAKTNGKSGFAGMIFMAMTLVVVSFSCTAPVLGYLLVEIAVQGSLLAPAVGMFAFSVAVALPFTLFAVFPAVLKRIPRSGMWMNHLKVTLGFLELAFSLKFLSVADMAYGWGILPRWLFLALWIVIFLLLSLYHTQWLHFRKAGWLRLGIAALSLAFVVYLIPGLFGAPCHLVSAFAPPADSGPVVGSADSSEGGGIKLPVHYSDYEQGMEAAAMTGKPVLLDFTGYGCVNCRKMESAVWGMSSVNEMINQDYLVIMLHVDDRTPLPRPQRVTVNGRERILRSVGDVWSYLESYKFGSVSQPFYVLLTPEGRPLTHSYGYDEDVDKYLRYLKAGLERYKKL